ncbi:arsenate reductase family protein [Prevotella sp. 10(H)]|uniref:arsenate reductase family protein n=1 Tax=Prevotella sp. 10(H) TaxID=1158294 RepID=UPI0004A6FA86|nr:arsenate reductase family protein [Prevotella sp. 10(H)]
MSTKLFLQYPKCSTCRNVSKWLKHNNIEVESRDITTDNPTRKELAAWIKKSGLPVSRFFNTSGRIYKEQNLKDKVKTASENELIDILASNGMVVKRPLVITGDLVLVGFNEEEWADKLK